MRTTLLRALCAAILLLLPVAAGADSLAPGTLELAPSFSFGHSSLSASGNNLENSTTVNLNTTVGYCFTGPLELAGTVLLGYQSFSLGGGYSASTSLTLTGITGGLIYNFNTASGPMIPFAEAGIGVVGYSGDLAVGTAATVIAPTVSIGTRVMVGHSGSVNFAFNYEHQLHAGGIDQVDANNFGLSVGMSLFPIRH